VFLAARSFGVETVHAVNDVAAGSLAADLPAYAARLRPLEGAALRRAVLDLDADGVPVGDLLYDTYLRAQKCATIDTCSNELLLEVSLALNTVRFMRSALDRHPRIEAAVVGHDCYVLYGILCRLAEQRGGDVHLVSQMKFTASVQRYTATPADERTRMRICRNQFAAALNGDRATAIARGQALIAGRMAGRNDRRAGKMGGFDPDKQTVSLPGLFGRADDAPSGRPILCIMASTLADAPHSNSRNVYDDQYVWLIKTLEIARQMPEADWVVKLHPFTGLYMKRDQIDAIVSHYVESTLNMRLLRETVNTRSLLGAIDGMVTPWGTAGLEFATQGVPVVTAGNTFYSGLGFTADPRTAAEYRAAIADLPGRRGNADTVARASVAAYLAFDGMLCDCSLMADVEAIPWQAYDEIALWQDAAERVAAYRPDEDPLWQRIERYQVDRAFSI
jgi:Capsule polysaccharide biosynthesis protein